MDVSNVQVSTHIPDDIVFSILSKLSLKALRRFECVCKLWSLLFDSNSYFMTMYRNYFLSKEHPFYDDVSLLLHLEHQGLLYSLSGERFENIVTVDWPKLLLLPHLPVRGPRIVNNGFSYEILSAISFDGTLCLKYHTIYDNKKLMMWNPTTTEFKIISDDSNSSSNVWAHHYQIGYDHVKDDYKMIRCTHSLKPCGIDCLEDSSFWEIFSLNSNSWRKVGDVDIPHSNRSREEVYLDGVSHWLDKTWMVSFDFIKESFITTDIPSYADDDFDFNSSWRRLLAVFNGSMAFIVNQTKTTTFHISILGEVGVNDSWTKLFIVGPLPCLKYPIGIGKKGNILIKKKNNELAWFDINTGMIVDIGVTAESHCKLLFHKESLLAIGGIYSKFSSCFHPQAI